MGFDGKELLLGVRGNGGAMGHGVSGVGTRTGHFYLLELQVWLFDARDHVIGGQRGLWLCMIVAVSSR